MMRLAPIPAPGILAVRTSKTQFQAYRLATSGKTPAPVCVAKGADILALRIREVAQANNVPIVENPPLARALYAAVEIDEAVPPEQYKAVAQVIGYVLRLTGRRSR